MTNTAAVFPFSLFFRPITEASTATGHMNDSLNKTARATSQLITHTSTESDIMKTELIIEHDCES